MITHKIQKQIIQPTMSQTNTYACPNCKKIKIYKFTFDQHVLLCNYRRYINTFQSNTQAEYVTSRELLGIITRQEQQIQKMSKQLSQINQLLNRQERRNICQHLNKIPKPHNLIPFSAWIANIEISFPFILSMCQTDIRDALFECFRQYYNAHTHPIPIKAFIENKSKIYLYDIETIQHPHHATEPQWFVLTHEHFAKIVGEIYKKWKRTFAKWMMENQDEFDVNHDMNEMKQAYMNKMDRYNHLSDKEKIVKIKNWIVQKVETTIPQIVIVDA